MEIDKHKMEAKTSALRSNINLGPGPGFSGMGSSSMNRPMGMDMDAGGCMNMNVCELACRAWAIDFQHAVQV